MVENAVGKTKMVLAAGSVATAWAPPVSGALATGSTIAGGVETAASLTKFAMTQSLSDGTKVVTEIILGQSGKAVANSVSNLTKGKT